LIDSRCAAVINRYTALRPTPEHVGRLGGGHEWFHDHGRFLPGPVPPQARGSEFPLRLLSRSKVVPRCTFCASRRCRVLLSGGRWSHRRVPLALDFVGG
jgi:hypothetical protein